MGKKEIVTSNYDLTNKENNIEEIDVQNNYAGLTTSSNALIKKLGEFTQSKIIEGLSIFAIKFAEFLIMPKVKEFFENVGKASITIHYIKILNESKWPLYLIDDAELRTNITTASINHESIDDIIFEYCDDNFVSSLLDDWENNDIINNDRKPLLNEGIQLHKQGFYYGSTSIFMCQIYGISSEINKIVKKYNMQLDTDMKDLISERFEIDKANIDSEKGLLFQTFMMTENAHFLWRGMFDYLHDEILSSSSSKKRWAKQPLRNKICHGSQLNFGTKEHSLKAILTIDMIIKLANEINRVGTSKFGV